MAGWRIRGDNCARRTWRSPPGACRRSGASMRSAPEQARYLAQVVFAVGGAVEAEINSRGDDGLVEFRADPRQGGVRFPGGAQAQPGSRARQNGCSASLITSGSTGDSSRLRASQRRSRASMRWSQKARWASRAATVQPEELASR